MADNGARTGEAARLAAQTEVLAAAPLATGEASLMVVGAAVRSVYTAVVRVATHLAARAATLLKVICLVS